MGWDEHEHEHAKGKEEENNMRATWAVASAVALAQVLRQ